MSRVMSRFGLNYKRYVISWLRLKGKMQKCKNAKFIVHPGDLS